MTGLIYDVEADTYGWWGGGDGGIDVPFEEPVIIAAGHHVWAIVGNWANHNTTMIAAMRGYLV